jgi:predicted RNA methylase
MIRHYTPIDVAQVLAKHLPRNISSLLEPAVGTGLLLSPILRRLKNKVRVVGVDIDSAALGTLKASIPSTPKVQLELIRADFLKWSSKTSPLTEADQFDCVLMNPPFSARLADFVKLRVLEDFPDLGVNSRSVPVEAAFLLRSLVLLRPGGRLLGIFPASLISSISTAWLRNLLLQLGSVLYVHELPRFTFKDVEARVYLFVYEKCSAKSKVLLCNHDLIAPESLTVRRSELGNQYRLDYSFHRSRLLHNTLRAKTPDFGWLQLRDVAAVLRGGVPSPEGPNVAVHTTDYQRGFWRRFSSLALRIDPSSTGLRRGDILVKRVGRDCGRSFGRAVGHIGHAASDCVLVIRPNKVNESTQLMFALRVLLACDLGAALIERGTGAPYLTDRDLRELYIPFRIADSFAGQYKHYKEAIRKHRFDAMKNIEKEVQSVLVTPVR